MIRVIFEGLAQVYDALGIADPGVVDQTLMLVARSAHDRWVELAQNGLHTARQAYVQGIQQPVLTEPGRVVLELRGWLANAIEQGMDPYSLREGLLSGPGARTAADGHRYRVVALRMTKPGSVGALGQPMDRVYAPPGPDSRSGRQGAATAREAQAIGRSIYRSARKLAPGQGLPPTGLQPLQPHHSSDPFTGMQQLGAKGHRYYAAFRTVSDNVDKWNHPGFSGRHFAPDAAVAGARVLPDVVQALITAAAARGVTSTKP